MKKPAKTTSRRPVVVELSGDLTIRGARDARERVLSKMAEKTAVTISVSEESSVDLTLVQLIEAARRELRDAGGQLTFATPAPQPLLDVLTRGGFLEAAEGRQFWLGAGE